MSLLFVDSFDHYATADLIKKYDLASGVTIETITPRNGLQYVKFATSSGNLIKMFPSNTTWIMGIGIRTLGTMGGSQDHDIFEIADETEDSVNDTQISFQYNFDKKFRVVRGNEIVGTQLAISDSTFNIDDGWHFVEFQCVINNTTGSFSAQFDGVTIAGLTKTGQDTRNGANDLANTIFLRPVVAGSITDCLYDDYYIANGSTPGIIAMLGDMKVDALFPKADGNYEEFTNSSGTNAFALVNINPPDNDTSHVESNVANEKNSFDMDDAGNFVIHGVQHVLDVRKTASNVRKIKHLTRIAGTDHKGDLIRMGESFNMKTKVWETNPQTGSQWIHSGLNGAEFGMEVI